MKQMNYIPSRLVSELGKPPLILDNNVYKGYEYYILSLGTHPTAYVKLCKDDKFYGYDYDRLSELVDVHGGFTYSRDYLTVAKDESDVWFVGWDYAHYGDYSGFDILYTGEDYNDNYNMKHSTFKIFEDVISVVNQLKAYNNEE